MRAGAKREFNRRAAPNVATIFPETCAGVRSAEPTIEWTGFGGQRS